MILTTVIFWVLNEALQITGLLNSFELIKFLVFHLSSFYGAIILCILVLKFRLQKCFMLLPIPIELTHSFITCRCIDYWDLAFSFFGISLVLLLLYIEHKKDSGDYKEILLRK